MKGKWLRLLAVVTVLTLIGLPSVLAQEPAVTVGTLQRFVPAFNAHDLERRAAGQTAYYNAGSEAPATAAMFTRTICVSSVKKWR
jgi:hypothetical protein